MIIFHLTRWEENTQPALTVQLPHHAFLLTTCSSVPHPTPHSDRAGVQSYHFPPETSNPWGCKKSSEMGLETTCFAQGQIYESLKSRTWREHIPNGNITMLSVVNPLPSLTFVCITIALKKPWAPSGYFWAVSLCSS